MIFTFQDLVTMAGHGCSIRVHHSQITMADLEQLARHCSGKGAGVLTIAGADTLPHVDGLKLAQIGGRHVAFDFEP